MNVKRVCRDITNRINPGDLLTLEEIYTILSCVESPRDKAIFALMAESGARAGEIATLQVKHIKFNQYGLTVELNGKTGKREVPLVICKPDLEIWLNNHMFAADPEALLFPRFNKKQHKLNLQRDGIWNVTKKTVARARLIKKSLLTKKVTPHTFRHTRATELAALGWTEAMLRAYFGWTADSTMPSVYIHLSQTDVAKQYYGLYGKIDTNGAKPRLLQEAMERK